MFVVGKGYIRITEALLSHPEFRDARRLTASPAQADMLDDFYAYDEDGTRYKHGYVQHQHHKYCNPFPCRVLLNNYDCLRPVSQTLILALCFLPTGSLTTLLP